MTDDPEFDLRDFLPYALNLAAEVAGRGFQQHYKAKYDMLRNEWRVIFHLGRHGAMTATEIGARALLHKTKVSRAVAALENKRFLMRRTLERDRRHESLELTARGRSVFADLYEAARAYDNDLTKHFTIEEQATLRRCLARLAEVGN